MSDQIIKPDSHQTHRVRQVLMNELGLTRETVRLEMVAIVEQSIGNEVSKLMENGEVKRMISQAVKDLAKSKSGYNSSDSFRDIVTAEAKLQVAQFVKDHLKITA